MPECLPHPKPEYCASGSALLASIAIDDLSRTFVLLKTSCPVEFRLLQCDAFESVTLNSGGRKIRSERLAEIAPTPSVPPPHTHSCRHRAMVEIH